MTSARVVCLAISILLAGSALAAAPADRPAPAGRGAAPELIEEVQDVTPAQPVAGPRGGGWLGRMHPAVVHFPIAWVLLLVIVEAAAFFTRREDLSSAGFLLLALACLSFIPAGLTGFLRASAMGHDPEFMALLVPHRNLNIAAAATCFSGLALRLGLRMRFAAHPLRRFYLLLVLAAAALLLVSGHLGGKMVFGADFLPF